MEDHSVDVATAIADYHRGEKRNMDCLINHVTQAQTTDYIVKKFFSECISCLNDIPQNLAVYLFKLFLGSRPWHSFAPEQAEQCLLLIVHISVRFEHLVDELLLAMCESICNLPKLPDGTEYTFEIILKVIREYLSLAPQSESQLVENLLRTLPNWGRPALIIFTALANVLKLCYISPPIFNPSSVQRILDALVALLVEIEINTEVPDRNLDSRDCPISSLEQPFNESEFAQNVENIIPTITPTANSANLVLWLFIMCIQQIFHGRPEPSKSAKKREWIQMCAIYRAIRTRFVQHILPVQSTFSAFPLLLLNFCSLRPGLMVSLLENLWGTVTDSRQPDEVRIRCMTYLADCLAHATYCTVEVVLEQLSDLAAWCVEYTYFRRGSLPFRFKQMLTENSLFYVVFESIIHVITYRQAELIGNTRNRHACAGLPLGQLINCPFKPLDALKPGLRNCFLSVASGYRMTWTATMSAVNEPVDPDIPPQPSYACPFSNAVAAIPFASQLGLLCNYAPAKRLNKRVLQIENGTELSSSTAVSSSEDYQQPSEKRVTRKIKAKHFNFNALANLD